MAWDKARFYTISPPGVELPSVTTILDVISKPALIQWAANQERKAFETAMLDVLSGPLAREPEHILEAVIKAVSGVKAMEREKQKAGAIGAAAHAWIEWRTRGMLGESPGPEPVISDAAQIAVEAWKDWAKAVEFHPTHVEQTIYCLECGYAGTFDWIGYVRDRITLGDIKTGKAIYPEAFLQNRAYVHAAHKSMPRGPGGVIFGRITGLITDGLILRLPKTLEDPTFEAMAVPETDFSVFVAALALWQWTRHMQGLPVGGARRGAPCMGAPVQ